LRVRRDEPPPAGQVDINTADADTLATIPGIGPGLAERIVAFRTSNGPFASVDELLDVSGITDRRLDALLPYVIAR
jgi:competence protein ComEA